MTVPSILFPEGTRRETAAGAAPDFFGDLHLDQIVAAIVQGKEEYGLEPFFQEPLRDAGAIAWRQAVMRDLEAPRRFDSVRGFAQKLRTMRKRLAQAEAMESRRQRQRWFLDAVEAYGDAVAGLAQDLSAVAPASRGWRAFGEYITQYASSEPFRGMMAEATKLAGDLAAIHYVVALDGLQVEVRRYRGEADASTEVEATFAAFSTAASTASAAKDPVFGFLDAAETNPVEAKILELVAKLYPETFAALDRFHTARQGFAEAGVLAFDREVQFYIAYREYMARLQAAGLPFCYPRVEASKEIHSEQGFDLALAGTLVASGGTMVNNDFHLSGGERTIVVTGPNQGGKTTFARMFGQLHYLTSLGCPAPGRGGQFFLFDQIFTHFEKEEGSGTPGGKLYDDVARAHGILERATPDSIILLNEIFASTTPQDALALSKKIAAQIADLGAVCVWVTFLDELASLNERTVSMASAVEPENPVMRTFKITRRPADGLAYAMALAERHHLTYARIRERMGA